MEECEYLMMTGLMRLTRTELRAGCADLLPFSRYALGSTEQIIARTRTSCETDMAVVKNLLGLTNALSVQIGTIWRDSMTLENALHKFCKHIFVLTGDEQFPYNFRGSGAAVKIAGRHFLFCCRHQIGDCRPDQIAIRLSHENRIMSASTMRWPAIVRGDEDDDSVDFVVFEFFLENYPAPNLTSEFFPLEEERIWPTGSVRLPFMIFGYPTERQLIDYEASRLQARSLEVPGVYDGGTNSPHLHRVKMQRDKPFDADGLSGGPIFYVGGSPGNYFAGFVGITARGSATSDYLHFIAAHHLIDIALDDRTSAKS
jgi:hypothetical protein